MQAGVYVSSGDKLKVLSLDGGSVLRETAIEDCGAVCAGEGVIYAASEKDRAIYRLDKHLLPCGVFAGGPGMSAMRLTGDATRLFVLLSDADGVLMLNGQDGLPTVFARTGVNPRQMRLECEDGCLTVAGGRDGSAMLLSAHTLECLCALRWEGVCCDALFCGGRLFALLLTPTLNTCLICREMHGPCYSFSFPGEPGSLYRRENLLLVSAGKWLYAFDINKLRLKKKVYLNSFSGRLIPAGEETLLLCPADETLRRISGGTDDILCRQARDAVCV